MPKVEEFYTSRASGSNRLGRTIIYPEDGEAAQFCAEFDENDAYGIVNPDRPLLSVSYFKFD